MMNKNEQKSLLIDTTKNMGKQSLLSVLEYIIKNSDKNARDRIEQYLMDNEREAYTLAWGLNIDEM